MKTARQWRLLVSVWFLISLPAVPTEKDDGLVDESYRLSQMLGGREQLTYLIELCHLSPHLNLSTKKTQEYSLALFRLASTGQDAKLRIIGQKNAVTCLSHADPTTAMELLSKIGFQQQPGQWLYEDPRYNAAETAFVNLITMSRSQNTIDSVTANARYLGQTGQYPYFGVGMVIDRLPPDFKNQINTLFNDAVQFYVSESGFYNRDEEFLFLLRSLHNPSVDKDLIVRALTVFAQRLTSSPIHFPGDYYAEIHVDSSGKVFPFTDRNEAFLFLIFPAIRKLNPTLAMELRQRDAKLDEATDGMHYIPGGFVQGSPTSQQAARQHFQWLQESLVSRIKEQQGCNPESVVQLAYRITDPSLRIVGFSAILPALARSNPSEGHSIYEKQLSELGNLSNPIGRLRATVAVASAAYQLGDFKQFKFLSMQAFDMGFRLFSNDVKASHAQLRQGFDELHDLITFTASQRTDFLLEEVQQLPDDWLKAYLWLYEADGHGTLRALPMATKSCSDAHATERTRDRGRALVEGFVGGQEKVQ